MRYLEVHDIEVFPNYSLFVFYRPSENKYFIYEISEWKNDIIELKKHCNEIGYYIGYNNSKYDCPMLEFALKNKSYIEIYEKSCEIIKSQKIYTKLNYIDVQLVNHYNANSAKHCSLKKLSFNLRRPNVYDTELSFNEKIKEKDRKDVEKYCIHDVDDTYIVYQNTTEKLKQRKELSSLFNIDLKNDPQPTMGEKTFSKLLNIDPYELKSRYVEYPNINLKDIIFPYIGSGEITDIGKEFFSNINLLPTKKGYKFEKDSKKTSNKYKKEYNWKDLNIVWGLGGIHGATSKGLYESDNDYVIKSFDVASEYPTCIINNNLYPILLGPAFLNVYKWLKTERFKYPKKSILSESYKLLLNLVYGKLNSEYSIFRDPKMLFTVTINCQLMINWICDMLSVIPDSKFLLANTDGCEIRIPRIYEDQYYKICSEWEKLTNFTLEHVNYNKIYIKDVNNYIGQFEDNKIKRKGLFVTYEDVCKMGDYHKDTSNNIVPLALTEYYINNINPEDFIKSHDNIYDFLLGINFNKTKKHGESLMLLTNQNEYGVSKFKKSNVRFLRYYASNSGYTGSKLFKDLHMENIHSDTKITPLEKIKKNDTVSKLDINYDWYLNEVYKIIK